MKKTIIAVALALLITPVLGTTTTAQAATWHKGTPKAIRGKFQAKIYNPNQQGFGDEYHITTKAFIYQASNMSQMKATKLRYRKIGKNTWQLKGHVQKRGMVLAGPLNKKIYRHGNRFAAVDYGYAFSKQDWAKPVKAFH